MAKVLFRTGTYAQYSALSTKDASTIYFISDTQQIFKGAVDYSSSTIVVDAFPETGIQGKLYINSSTLEAKIYVGTAWKTVNPGVASKIDGTSTTDDAKLATIAAIKTYVQSSVTTLTDELNKKAPLASPTFTGTVTLPDKDLSSMGDLEAVSKKHLDALDEAIESSISELETTLTSADAQTLSNAKAYADSILGANDAMVYKGTIGTDGTVTGLPDTHSTGWTYKVITAGTYAGVTCEIGDMIICVADGTAANNADWTVIQNNIDGAVTGPTSAVTERVVVFNGTSGRVIKDSGYTIASSVPTNAKFTDTTFELASNTSAANGAVKINLTDSSDGAAGSVTIKGEGATSVTTDESGNIIVTSADQTAYSLTGTAQTVDDVDTVTVELFSQTDGSEKASCGSVTFVAGDNISISADGDNIKFSVTAFVATNVAMTGYTKGTATAVTATDTVSSAIGKLEAQIGTKANASHNQAANTITAMTGYTIGTSAAAIAATDSLNTAIAKLEYGKAPKANPTFTGVVTLGDEPTADKHAATKAYVDTTVENALAWQTI